MSRRVKVKKHSEKQNVRHLNCYKSHNNKEHLL
jgi:hypothetical protein